VKKLKSRPGQKKEELKTLRAKLKQYTTQHQVQTATRNSERTTKEFRARMDAVPYSRELDLDIVKSELRVVISDLDLVDNIHEDVAAELHAVFRNANRSKISLDDFRCRER